MEVVGVAEGVEKGADGAGFGFEGAEDEGVDAGAEEGPGAHGAGLQGDDEFAAVESPAPEGARGGPDGFDFGVRCGVLALFAPVDAAANDLAVGVEDEGADGHVPGRGRGGKVERLLHASGGAPLPA